MSVFQIEEKPSVVVLKCPENLDVKAAHELLDLVKEWVKKPVKLYALDFAKVTTIDVVAYRPFMLFHQALKKHGSYVATINLRDSLALQVKAGGLDSVLSPKKDLDDAMVSAGLKTEQKAASQFDMELLTPFINAVKSTIEIQANTKISIGSPRLKEPDERFSTDIAGVISMASSKYSGSIALCFPATVFLLIYSNMLGEKHTEITRETEDAAGELLNMIFGQAKAELNNYKNYDVQRAIPAIVRGQQLHVHHLSRGMAVVIPVQTDAGPFQVEISVEPV
ncbi:MAG: chemotaxis protein CheX [Oligoflexia bacterium]|nr:chemotaxis protein CheX [Oligoflexia bacterium]